MSYIVVLQTKYLDRRPWLAGPVAKSVVARDIDDARTKAATLAVRESRPYVTEVQVVAVFDALTGAIGPTVDKEFD